MTSAVPRFLVPDSVISADRIEIGGPLAGHLLHSLRVLAGDRLTVADASGLEHGIIVEAAAGGSVRGRIAWTRAAAGEPRTHVSLLHALIREFDEVVAGLTHIGVTSIRPLVTSRTVIRPAAVRIPGRMSRWRAISLEAAQLAGRVRPSEILPPEGLASAISGLQPGTRLLACTVDAPAPLSRLEIRAGQSLAIVIGPEGGLDQAELDLLHARNAESVHLGVRVLPARAAGVVAAAIALSMAGDLDDTAKPAPWPR